MAAAFSMPLPPCAMYASDVRDHYQQQPAAQCSMCPTWPCASAVHVPLTPPTSYSPASTTHRPRARQSDAPENPDEFHHHDDRRREAFCPMRSRTGRRERAGPRVRASALRSTPYAGYPFTTPATINSTRYTVRRAQTEPLHALARALPSAHRCRCASAHACAFPPRRPLMGRRHPASSIQRFLSLAALSLSP